MQAMRAATTFCRSFRTSTRVYQDAPNGEQLSKIHDLYQTVGGKASYPAVWGIGLGFTGLIGAGLGYTHQQIDRKIDQVRDEVADLRRQSGEDFRTMSSKITDLTAAVQTKS